jgi:uncharacterized protein YkwD
MLAAHNHFRCLHGAPPLGWSDEVASYAQTWVDTLTTLEHSDSYASPLGPLGENLYRTSGEVRAADVVASWYAEGAKHAYGDTYQPETGHFTALIWRDAKVLGCGVHGGIVSCNYGSGGLALTCATPNLAGCFTEQVQRPIADPSKCASP